ncbi:MAG: hypothetical protein AB8B69_18165 [Chitinophagales bacterium]
MNLLALIPENEKTISTKRILNEKGNGTATLLQLKKGALLKKHHSKTNAVLILLTGKAVYEEDERTVLLAAPNDWVEIPEMVVHEVLGEEDSLLLLIQ